MIRSIKIGLTGISIPQEYVCLGLRDVEDLLTVTVSCRRKIELLDVTSQHLFLGYKPLVIAIIFSADEKSISHESEVCLTFTNGEFELNTRWNEFNSDNKSVARLLLRIVDTLEVGHSRIIFYQGTQGKHTFLSSWHQKVNALLERLRKKSEGNISLPRNLYEQVRIAYSIPRLVALITVYDGTMMNLFPTDLHGDAGSGFYLGSLRIGGLACEQVEKYRRIVISEVDSTQYKQVYSHGKQHMKPMANTSEFDLYVELSESFKFPLPKGVGRYRELELSNHFDAGIHRIFIYKIINDYSVMDINPLGHIHQYYAQWRMDNELLTNYLLR